MLKLTLIALALAVFGSAADIPAIFLAVHGALPLTFILVASFLADVIPDFLWYILGKKIGVERFGKLRFFRRNPERLEKMDRAFNKHGFALLFGSKFVSGTAIPAQIIAGAHRYPLDRMFYANALGSISWVTLLYFLAKTITSLHNLEIFVKDIKYAFVFFLLISISLYLFLGSSLKRILNRS
jgi:membrane protein DedA with SNARE-associated domain